MMLVLAGMEWKYLLAGACAAAPALAALLLLGAMAARAACWCFSIRSPIRRARAYHIYQSLIAVGTGGLTGRGYMEGMQKLFYLPEASTDFIFANIAEELGLIGAMFIVLLFVVFGVRGLRTAFRSSDPFARLVAFGITITILLQAFFNISVVLSLVPNKGIPLPLISYGGTSLFCTLASHRDSAEYLAASGMKRQRSETRDQSKGMAELRILIAGGGTGGHVFPALAVARELVKRHGAEILFVGTARGLETRLIPEAGFELRLIDVGPLKSVSWMTRLRTACAFAGQHLRLQANHPASSSRARCWAWEVTHRVRRWRRRCG